MRKRVYCIAVLLMMGVSGTVVGTIVEANRAGNLFETNVETLTQTIEVGRVCGWDPNYECKYSEVEKYRGLWV